MWFFSDQRLIDYKFLSIVLFVCFFLFVCLWIYDPLEDFSLIWIRHHYRWRASTLDHYSTLIAIEQREFFSVYTYCDKARSLIMVISENLWHSHLMPSVLRGVLIRCFYDLYIGGTALHVYIVTLVKYEKKTNVHTLSFHFKECYYNYYGVNCKERCNDRCIGCNRETGACENGCQPGWKGIYCHEGERNIFLIKSTSIYN